MNVNVKMKMITSGCRLAAVTIAAAVATTAVASADCRRDRTGTQPGAMQNEASQVPFSKSLARPRCSTTERAGFEPAVPFRAHGISNAAQSAALSPLPGDAERLV